MFVPDNNPVIKFSPDLSVKTGHLFIRAVFTIKSTKDLESKYKPGLDYYLGQTLGWLEAKKRNLRNDSPNYAITFFIAKISLLSF